MADPDKTEKATPKRLEEARGKGQVARSADVNGAVVLAVALVGLGALAPRGWALLQAAMHDALVATAHPEAVRAGNLGAVLGAHARTAALLVAPVAALCLVGGVAASVAQVRLKVTPTALKPDPKRINPLQGAKNVFGPNALFETAKAVAKLGAVGGIAALAVVPQLDELAALVGLPPASLAPKLAQEVFTIAVRGAVAYALIAAADYVYQRHKHLKGLRMSKQELKEEFKGQGLPAEVKSAQRRRQIEAARARMMAAIPQADVVVTNPTHFAVALAYTGERAAPEVVAKGQDLIAAQIRRTAEEHGVPVVPDPPLARSLHATVEVGQLIPEELYAAVAQVLAFVYRVAGRRASA